MTNGEKFKEVFGFGADGSRVIAVNAIWWDCQFQDSKPSTNADRIHSMRDEELVARIRYHINKANFYGLKEAESTLLLSEAADAIEDLQKQRKTGKWIENGEPNAHGKYELWYYTCSLCGAVGVQQYNYCPNCGKKMVTDDV